MLISVHACYVHVNKMLLHKYMQTTVAVASIYSRPPCNLRCSYKKSTEWNCLIFALYSLINLLEYKDN